MIPKPIAIIILVLAILGIAGGVTYWYLSINNKLPWQQTAQENPDTVTNGSGQTGIFPNSRPRDTKNDTKPTDTTDTNSRQKAPAVRQISSEPTAGFTTLERETGPWVRFMDKKTGHIFDAPLDIVSRERVTNTTLPAVEEVSWFNQGTALIARYLSDRSKDVVRTYTAIIPSVGTSTPTGEIQLSGSFMADNIRSLTTLVGSTSKNALAQIVYTRINNGVSSVYTSQIDGNKPKLIASVPLLDVSLVKNGNNKNIYLQTNASSMADGELFKIDTQTGSNSIQLSNIQGLSSLPSPKGDMVAFSTGGSAPTLWIKNLATGELKSTALHTMIEKCAWIPRTSNLICGAPRSLTKGDFPDSWYQGITSFEDVLWKVHGDDGTIEELVDLNAEGARVDVLDPEIASSTDYIVFRNKYDLSLWSVRIATPAPVVVPQTNVATTTATSTGR